MLGSLGDSLSLEARIASNETNIGFILTHMSSRTERFQRKSREKKDGEIEEPEIIKFSPEEEGVSSVSSSHPEFYVDYCLQALIQESNKVKQEANDLFGKSAFQEAIATYDRALATCPNYLDYEVAVLKSNIAACHLKLEDWKEAVKAASVALDGLDRLQGKGEEKCEGENVEVKSEEEADEEIVSEGATKAENTSEKGKRDADIDRIRGKALMRRARARSELGGWSALQGAEEGEFTSEFQVSS